MVETVYRDPLTRAHAEWARRVKNRRRALMLTQTQLARMAEVTQPVISDIERGTVVPRDGLKWRLAGALRCSMGDLFPWPSDQPPPPVGYPDDEVAA